MVRAPIPALVFAVIFVFIFLLHAPLLRLPYFWDEAGYYVPAARDLLLTGSLIPHSTVSNAHPPLVMAWLALWWKVVGYAPLVTRTAMLVVAAFSLLGLFRLAERVANTQVAIASTLCTALYPVFFAQSSLAQVDLAAAGLIFWGLAAYVEGETIATAFWFALAALAKETAILSSHGPCRVGDPRPACAQEFAAQTLAGERGLAGREPVSVRRIASLLIPAMPLALWYGYHYARTGYVFGNPEFFRYNVAATFSFTRFLFALAMRLWQISGYLHLWVLTLAMLVAMCLLPPRRDPAGERPRISLPVQMVFYVVMLAYVVAMALIGGAVLARYMLPAVPLVIIVSVSTLWRRLHYWLTAVACVAIAFVVAWFWNPPYGFSLEDNLAYGNYVVLHEDGEHFLEARYPMRAGAHGMACLGRNYPALARLYYAADAGRSHRELLAAMKCFPRRLSLELSGRAGLLYEIRTWAGGMGSLADLDRSEDSLLRISPRPAACSRGADPRRPHRIFRTTAGPVGCRN